MSAVEQFLSPKRSVNIAYLVQEATGMFKSCNISGVMESSSGEEEAPQCGDSISR